MNTGIALTEATVRHGRRAVLDAVSLTVPPGSVLAVTGASGSGKTTLLWLLAGLTAPDEGTATVDGEPIPVRRDAVATGVHLIPQGNGLASVLTAHENVLVALLADGVEPDTAAARATECLERLGVSGQSAQLAEELSGGQRQRVAIARGLALGASVLLADEVTSDLDVDNRDRVLELLRAEAKRGACVVFATNDVEAAAACDARVHLSDGHIATPGSD